MPRERLVVETDSPFLAPEGRRGKRNEPAYVRPVLERVAAVRGVDVDELETATDANAARLFGFGRAADLVTKRRGAAPRREGDASRRSQRSVGPS